MKTLAIVLIASGGLLSGCVAYETPTGASGSYYGPSSGPYYSPSSGPYYTPSGSYYYGDRDRDRDGIRDSQDRYPDDPRRY